MPAAAIPANVPVPSWLSANVSPLGSDPTTLNEGVGEPVVVTRNDPAAPIVNVALAALVIAAGLPIVKFNEFDEPPPGDGFATNTGTVPPVANSEAAILAVIVVPLLVTVPA